MWDCLRVAISAAMKSKKKRRKKKKGKGPEARVSTGSGLISQGNDDDEAISLDQWPLTFWGSEFSGSDWVHPSNTLIFVSAFLLQGTFLLHGTLRKN